MMRKINVPIYDIDIYMSNDMNDYVKWLKTCEIEPDQKDKNVSKTHAGLSDFDNGNGIMIISETENDGVIVHEAVHTAWHILDHAGVIICIDNHESLAYLTEWLYDTYIKRFRN